MTEPQPVMDQAEQERLTRQVGRALLTVAGQDWKQVRAEYRAAGRHVEVDVFVSGPDGQPRPVRPPQEVVEGLGRLRQGMYRPGRGTWLSALYLLDPPSTFSAEFEPDIEPRWRRMPPPIGFVDELRFFPRAEEHIPDWFRQRAGLPPAGGEQPAGQATPPGGTSNPAPGQMPVPGHGGTRPPAQAAPPGSQQPGHAMPPGGPQPAHATPPGGTQQPAPPDGIQQWGNRTPPGGIQQLGHVTSPDGTQQPGHALPPGGSPQFGHPTPPGGSERGHQPNLGFRPPTQAPAPGTQAPAGPVPPPQGGPIPHASGPSTW